MTNELWPRRLAASPTEESPPLSGGEDDHDPQNDQTWIESTLAYSIEP